MRYRHRFRLVRFQNRAHDFPIAGAAAKNAAERVHDLCLVGARISVEQRDRGNQHAGSADTALRCAVPQERLLQTIEGGRRRAQTFNRFDYCAIELPNGSQAGTHGLPVDENGAGSAIARIAADFCPDEMKLFAQHLRKAQARIGTNRAKFTVEIERNLCCGLGLCFAPHAVAAFCAQASRARPTRVRAASRRYSAVARTSSMGESRARCSAFTICRRPGRADCPTRARSSSASRSAAAEQEPTQTSASRILPEESTTRLAATITIEMTKYLRPPSFRNVENAYEYRRGTRT